MNGKLNLYFLALFLLCSSCSGLYKTSSQNSDQQSYYVKRSDALKVALKIHRITKSHQIQRSGSLNGRVKDNEISSYHAISSGQNQIALHIYNFVDGGFVVLSADTRTQAVLAFSQGNTFEFARNIPTGVSLWLDEMISMVEETRRTNRHHEKNYAKEIDDFIGLFGGPSRSVKVNSRDSLFIGQSVKVHDTLKTLWAQQKGFNNYMPRLAYCGTSSYPSLPPENNGRAYTGCVATAMAQIIRYHEYPKKYDFSIMPKLVTTDNYNSKGANEVAMLMYDIASSLPFDANCEATGAAANIVDIVNAFENHFDYSPMVHNANYDFQTVKSEIAKGLPVILTAYRNQGLWMPTKGHAWVADGYIDYLTYTDTQTSSDSYGITLLHMNWGWGNTGYNGWYYSQTRTAGSYNYAYKKEMVVGIQP